MSTALLAQTEDTPASVDIFSLSLSELLDVRVTGSTLTSQSQLKAPSSVSVFTHRELRRLGVDSFTELMHLVPSFQSFGNGGSGAYEAYSARGRRIGGSSAEILVLIDGERIDSPGSSGSAATAARIPIDLIERIEFIRGPGSAIYGSNAMMGVINIVTRKGESQMEVSSGSLGRRRGTILAHYQTQDYELNTFVQMDKDDGTDLLVWDTQSAATLLTDDPRVRNTYKVSVDLKDTSVGFQRHVIRSRNFIEAGYVANGANYRESITDVYSAAHEFTYSGVDSYVRASYRSAREDFVTHIFPAGALNDVSLSSPTSTAPMTLQVSSDTPMSETRLAWHNDLLLEGSDWVFGAELRRVKIPDLVAKSNYDIAASVIGQFPIRYFGEPIGTLVVEPKAERTISGVYSQGQFQFGSQHQITLGLRYDHFSDLDSSLSPRFAWVYQPVENQSIKLLYGSAFRAPTANELDLIAGGKHYSGNKKLKSEVAETIELAWAMEKDTWSISLGYFETHFDNAIVRVPNEIESLQHVNKDQEPVKGLEVELAFEATESTLLKTAFSQFFSLPDSSFREAEGLFSMTLNHQYQKWNLNVSASWYDETKMIANNDQGNLLELDEYWLVFAKVNYQMDKNWNGFVQIKNALDTQYLTPAESPAYPSGIDNREKEVLLGVSYQFTL